MNKSREIVKNLQLMDKLTNLMIKANLAILKVYLEDNKEVELKANNSPITKADLIANKILKDELQRLFPEIPVVSEEDESSLDIPRNFKTYWLIDPLDGTKEFINKSDEFTCNLALIENNISTLGFVSIPVKELVYFGGKEFGSKVLNKDKKISEVKYKSKKGICRVVASKNHMNEKTKKYIENFEGNVKLIQAGSSLKFIKIAEGLADIYPRLSPTSEWDTAAAQAIVEGAGGQVLQLNNEKVIYGKSNILNPHFIASGIR